jgi:signal transduction histidine kinase
LKNEPDNQGHAAKSLKKLKERIITLWIERALEEIPAALDKDIRTIRDEIPDFVNELVKTLSPANPKQDATEKNRLANLHGQQRAGLTQYSLQQVLKEYSLLRQILEKELQAEQPLTENERHIINLSIDSAIQIAGHEFAQAEQAKIKLALAHAEQSNRDLEHFAAIAAHDLKSPLTSIIGYTDLIERELKRRSLLEFDKNLTFIKSAAKRMTDLIDGVLSYASLGSSSQEFTIVSCKDVVNAAVQNLKVQITETGGSVGFDDLPEVRGNLPLLTQVFQNLFSNALKFRGSRPPLLHVKVETEKDFWRFCVTDNGIGFDPKQKESIFILYKRLSETSQKPGAGIGLATCRRVAELHGGKVWAESEPGKGSTFFFTLPKIQTGSVASIGDQNNA